MGFSNSKVIRDFLHAIKDAGIPFQTFDINTRKDVISSDYADIVTPRKDFNIRKFTHVVEMFRSPAPELTGITKARIAFWEGEHGLLDAFPYLASKNPVIAMSDYNADNFRKELPPSTPVFKIPYPLQRLSSDMDPRDIVRAKYGLGKEDFVVFYNFDLGSFHRKNPLAAMQAFAKAFANENKAKLVFKFNLAKDFPDRIAAINAEARHLGIADRVLSISGYLPQKEIHNLTNACDVYLSLHRAEGFGIGIAEAMQLGKPVIVTNYSAPTEFCQDKTAFLVSFNMVKINPGEYFTSMETWADADVDDAATALRKCYDNPAYAHAVGENARHFIEDHFSIQNFKKSVTAFLDAQT